MTGRLPFARSFRIRKMFRDWHAREYSAPAPVIVKRAVLRRHHIDGATWVETGTASGDTTAFLAGFARKVYTIEAQPEFHQAAAKRFRTVAKVEPLLGDSAVVFPKLLEELQGDVCFWLDGHYSGGTTFQSNSGDTPIQAELEALSQHLRRLGQVVVLIDDIRCFDPSQLDFRDYPPLDDVVDWARRNTLKWHIEQDIFVARKI